jgi:hypothetical protein
MTSRPQVASLRGELERRRIEHRARRVEQVLAALRARARAREATGGPVPAPLWHAVRGFEAELETVRDRLRHM